MVLPVDYEHRIRAEINNRVQQDKEPVSIYINEMERKFRTLPNTPTESAKVYAIRRNLLQHFITAVSALPKKSVAQLESACKRIEVVRNSSRRKGTPRSYGTRPMSRGRAQINEVVLEDDTQNLEEAREEEEDLAYVDQRNKSKDKRGTKTVKRTTDAKKGSSNNDSRGDRQNMLQL